VARKPKELEVEVAEVVDYMKITGQFEPALREVVVRKIVAEKARKSGLKVTNQKLQKAADVFRISLGLTSAAQTTTWLEANGIALEALEAYLETNLLISALKDNLLKKAAKKPLYNSKRLREAARELVYQRWLKKAIK
jgi:hypothetical protein